MAVHPEQITRCASQLSQHQSRLNGEDVVLSLTSGLTGLRNRLFARLHDDVQLASGQDSLLMPISPEHYQQMTKEAKREIDIYTMAITHEEVATRGYVGEQAHWFAAWLCNLMIDEPSNQPHIKERLNLYSTLAGSKRRRQFITKIEQIVPAATKAPLVVYRLYPLGVRLATAVAFKDHLRAGELRNDQQKILPAITDCHECLGAPLDNEESCHTCGSPLWNYEWLCSD